MILLILFLLFSPAVYAQTEMYAVQRDDGGVSIVYYIPGSSDTLEDVLRENELEGKPVKRIKEDAFQESKADRDFWTFAGSKIRLDQFKKQEAQVQKQAKESKKDEVLGKLKISEEDAKALREVINAK